MASHMKPVRLEVLPTDMRQALFATRKARGWSQAELGRRVGLPQMHISRIETGKVSPQFNTLLDLVRVLGHDLLLVPRALVPVTLAMVRDHERPDGPAEQRPLHADLRDDDV